VDMAQKAARKSMKIPAFFKKFLFISMENIGEFQQFQRKISNNYENMQIIKNNLEKMQETKGFLSLYCKLAACLQEETKLYLI